MQNQVYVSNFIHFPSQEEGARNNHKINKHSRQFFKSVYFLKLFILISLREPLVKSILAAALWCGQQGGRPVQGYEGDQVLLLSSRRLNPWTSNIKEKMVEMRHTAFRRLSKHSQVKTLGDKDFSSHVLYVVEINKCDIIKFLYTILCDKGVCTVCGYTV